MLLNSQIKFIELIEIIINKELKSRKKLTETFGSSILNTFYRYLEGLKKEGIFKKIIGLANIAWDKIPEDAVQKVAPQEAVNHLKRYGEYKYLYLWITGNNKITYNYGSDYSKTKYAFGPILAVTMGKDPIWTRDYNAQAARYAKNWQDHQPYTGTTKLPNTSKLSSGGGDNMPLSVIISNSDYVIVINHNFGKTVDKKQQIRRDLNDKNALPGLNDPIPTSQDVQYTAASNGEVAEYIINTSFKGTSLLKDVYLDNNDTKSAYLPYAAEMVNGDKIIVDVYFGQLYSDDQRSGYIDVYFGNNKARFSSAGSRFGNISIKPQDVKAAIQYIRKKIARISNEYRRNKNSKN